VKRLLTALLIGGVFVCLLKLLSHFGIAARLALYLLMPGIYSANLLQSTSLNPEADLNTWGTFGQITAYSIDLIVYALLCYLVLFVIDRWRETA
jgi:hypothetical protein